jgi:succinoglycan biosynthesis protein ExoA
VKQNGYSIIIPASRENSVEQMKKIIGDIDYPKELVQVNFIMDRDLPSKKRNCGAIMAQWEYLIFFDDDLEVPVDYLQKLNDIILTEKADVVGGPNLGFQQANQTQQMIDLVFASWIGFGKGGNRFKSTGEIRDGTEDNLTANNLCIRKEVFMSVGGFDETLYPGEEVELIRKLRMDGHRLIYCPELVVFHCRRSSIPLLCKQIFYYGQGRVDVWKSSGFCWRDFTYLLPSLMVMYFFFLPYLSEVNENLPLGAYAYLSVLVGWVLSRGVTQQLSPGKMVTLFMVVLSVHWSYGIGMLCQALKVVLGRR